MAAAMTSDNLFHFVCAKCETHLSVDPAKAGAQAPCPKCGQTITAPPVNQSGVSSIEKVKNAVENKAPKSETKPVAVVPAAMGNEPINPRNGLTKSQEIQAEFGAVVKQKS